MSMTSEIRMIPIGQLEHHPENPRKNLGDLSELTESIRKNGIYQNLTVVADLEKQKYLVVIGNRRFEAAKAAGLVDLPCVISDMDHKEQIATMLEENMQRQDLTVYEQAQGFQMMMDLGYTPKEISEKTGFSETTVSRRLKMAELDKKAFQKAVGKQISMDDLDRLGKIESVKQRNALLKEFGENNFDWKLTRALKVQKASKMKTKAHQQLQEAKVEKIQDKDRYTGNYQTIYNARCELDKWDGKTNIIPKAKGKLFYWEDDTDIWFYEKETKKKKQEPERSKQEIEADRARAQAWKQVEADTKTADELRKAFVARLKMTPKNAPVMLTFFMKAVCMRVIEYTTPREEVRNLLGLKTSSWEERMQETAKALNDYDITDIPKMIGCFFDGESRFVAGYVEGTKSREMPKYKKNYVLDAYYDWLTAYGYKMSDIEIQLMSGTHPGFQVKV